MERQLLAIFGSESNNQIIEKIQEIQEIQEIYSEYDFQKAIAYQHLN